MKKIIKKIFDIFGFDIKKKLNKNETEYLSFDQIYKKIIKNDKPTVFDIGANKGQSIQRFLSIYQNSLIHSFEPNPDEFNLLKKKYNNFNNIKLNNFDLGEKKT